MKVLGKIATHLWRTFKDYKRTINYQKLIKKHKPRISTMGSIYVFETRYRYSNFAQVYSPRHESWTKVNMKSYYIDELYNIKLMNDKIFKIDEE